MATRSRSSKSSADTGQLPLVVVAPTQARFVATCRMLRRDPDAIDTIHLVEADPAKGATLIPAPPQSFQVALDNRDFEREDHPHVDAVSKWLRRDHLERIERWFWVYHPEQKYHAKVGEPFSLPAEQRMGQEARQARWSETDTNTTAKD